MRSRFRLRLPAAALALLLCSAASEAQPLEVSPDPLDFGVTRAGVGVIDTLRLRNTGSDELEIRLRLTGDAFSIHADVLRLAGGAERGLPVHFQAAAVGTYVGELTLQVKELFGGEQVSVALRAAVDRAVLSARPAAGVDAAATAVSTTVTRRVQLVNSGRVAVVIDSVVVHPAGRGFRVDPVAGRSLAPKESLTLPVTFAPTADGVVSGRIAVHAAALPSGVLDIPLRGEGLAPRLDVSPLADVGLDFGIAEVGGVERRRMTLINRGRADLDVQWQVAGGPFVVAGDSVAVLAPGERIDSDLLFRPRYEGPVNARLIVRSSDPSRPVVEIPLTASAEVSPPRIEILNPPPIHFGAVPIGRPAREQLLIWNRGGAPFTARLELESGEDPEFDVETSAVLLQPGESGKVELTFQPKEIGERETVLWVETEAGRTRLPLRGTGKFLKLTPSAYDFGRVPVGEAESGVVELVNIGNADFTISRIRSTSDDFTLYTQVSPDNKFLLPANSLRSLPINVTYEPGERGLSSATLRLEGFWEEGTETLEVLLNGTGVAAEIELHPAGTLDFGYVVLGDSTMRTIVATNSGDTALRVEANALTREARVEPSVFALDPGQSTTLRVWFSPEALGERFGQILLVSNDVRDKAQPIKIKGQGALENIDLSQITLVTASRKDVQERLRLPWNNTPLVVRDGTRVDLRFQVPDSLRQALIGRRIDVEWTQLDENYDPKGGAKQVSVQIYEDAEGSVLAEDFNLRMKESDNKRVRLKLTTHSYPGSPPQSVSQTIEAGGWKFEFEAKPLVSFLTIRPGRDWTDAEGNKVRGKTERLIGLPGIAFLGWHNAEHPAVSGVHLTAIGNVLEALSTDNSIAVSLGVAVSMYKDRFLFGFGWDIYDSRPKAKRKGSQDYIMTFKYSGLF
jgi:hypothetical protein